ncbi:MAG: nuclear transport factor 2 family protein [Methyloligellaceae bacterium]
MTDKQIITKMTEAYFIGLHEADIEKLKAVFHEDTVLKAPGIRRTRDEWLNLVASRPVPQKEGYSFNYKILSIDIMGEQAMVKVYCPLLGSEFIDFLGFLKEGSDWKIVNKMYSGK